MKEAIKICNLHKSFKGVHAVNDLSFNVKEGELFAFLGVNGAGKSTTISIICSTLQKDSGKVFIDGVDIDTDSSEIKNKIGVVFQNSVLDKSLTVRQNLTFRASLYGIFDKEAKERIDYLSTILEFKDFIDRPVGKLSGGQRRKTDIARALIHNPKILILDEPTTGLDPQTRITMWKVINDLRKELNMTVLLTTHYMEEAVDSDFVVIIDSGKMVAEGKPYELKNKYASDSVTVYGIDEEQAKLISDDYQKVVGGFKFSIKDTKLATDMIIKNPSLFVDYEVTKGQMDSVFLTVTGKNLVGGDE